MYLWMLIMELGFKPTQTQLEAYALLQKFGAFKYSRIHQAFVAEGTYSHIQMNTAKLLVQRKIAKGKKMPMHNNKKILAEISLLDENPLKEYIEQGEFQLPSF